MGSESTISLSIVFMIEPEEFYNRGYGWICRRCDTARTAQPSARSRLMCEGEAESKSSSFSSPALAKWSGPDRRRLVCPNCGVSEDLADE